MNPPTCPECSYSPLDWDDDLMRWCCPACDWVDPQREWLFFGAAMGNVLTGQPSDVPVLIGNHAHFVRDWDCYQVIRADKPRVCVYVSEAVLAATGETLEGFLQMGIDTAKSLESSIRIERKKWRMLNIPRLRRAFR